MTFFKKKEPAKPQFEQNNVNTALQAAITPIGLEFKRNEFLLGENYCRIYGIIGYPAEVDYGWYAKLTNIPGTIVTINSQPLDNGSMLPTMAKNINTARGIELSTKDAIERQRAKKTADDQEKMIQDMDQRNESLGSFSTLIMVLSSCPWQIRWAAVFVRYPICKKKPISTSARPTRLMSVSTKSHAEPFRFHRSSEDFRLRPPVLTMGQAFISERTAAEE